MTTLVVSELSIAIISRYRPSGVYSDNVLFQGSLDSAAAAAAPFHWITFILDCACDDQGSDGNQSLQLANGSVGWKPHGNSGGITELFWRVESVPATF